MTDALPFFTYLSYYLILSSLLRSVFVMFSRQLSPKKNAERRVRYMVNYGFAIDSATLLLALLVTHAHENLILHNFLFFGFDFVLSFDFSSIAFLMFCLLILYITARFSINYLSRDVYYFKFFALLYVLQIGVVILSLSLSLESLFIGWELLGISSVLLIAFYEHRMSVLKNSLRVLVIYKASNLLFYVALIMSAYMGVENYVEISGPMAMTLILFACLIKSSLFPWFWLPRAMEGPTPSTAIFYGALATHIPVYLYLRIAMHHAAVLPPVLKACLIGLLLVSVVCSSMLGRRINDVKNAIAYSGISQLGVIYIEILCGFYDFAAVHMVCHAIYRACEFFRSPSEIYVRHSMARNYKTIINASGFHYEQFLPMTLRNYLYRLAYHEFYLPKALMHCVDQFLALNTSYVNKRAMLTYVTVSFLTYLTIEGAVFTFSYENISYLDEMMLLLAYLFNILAMVNKYKPKFFFVALSLSVFVTFDVFLDNLYPRFVLFDITMPVVFLLLLFLSLKRQKNIVNRLNYSGRIRTTSFFSYFILLAGLAIVGIPGLGSFFAWSRLEHFFMTKKPGLIIQAFLLLTLNTVVFFRFYYANYLGKYDKSQSFETVHLS